MPIMIFNFKKSIVHIVLSDEYEVVVDIKNILPEKKIPKTSNYFFLKKHNFSHALQFHVHNFSPSFLPH